MYFCGIQEKRKIPVFPNGSAPMSAEPPKEAAHHAGPELQRTGRWVQLFLWGIKHWFDRKAPTVFCFNSSNIWNLISYIISSVVL